MKQFLKVLNLYDIILLSVSFVLLTTSFILQGDKRDTLSFIASLFGVVGILFIAKGMLIGQYITAVYAVLYFILSFLSSYYGECILMVITFVPSITLSIITWKKNPAKEKGVVKVNKLKRMEYAMLMVGIVVITVSSYFVLDALHTDQVLVSTISFSTSLGAAYLQIRRSEFYAIFYILNDVVLITLWSLAFAAGQMVLPSVISFCIFLANDTYGFFNWRSRKKKQEE